MKKRLLTVLGLVITVLIFVVLLVVIKNEQKRIVHANILVEIRPVVGGLIGAQWEVASQEVSSATLCRLELAHLTWGDVDSLLQKATRLGTPISLDEIGGEKTKQAQREVAIRYVNELIKAFDSHAKIDCGTINPGGDLSEEELKHEYGHNSRTLMAAWHAVSYLGLTQNEIGWSYDGIRLRAISLMKEWIEAQRVGKSSDDNPIANLTNLFHVSTSELGLETAEEVRRYYLQL